MPVQHTPVYITEAERLEQENAARQVRDLPERPRTYHIVTYGCQMNAHDSEKLAGILSGMGMAEAADRREADLVIFNTCCVRDNAERRALGNVTWLKELKKDKPGLIIGVCGCMVQQPGMAERILRQYRFIDLAFGTHNLHRLPSLLLALLTQKTRVVSVTDEENLIAEDLPVKRLNAWHAYITIMYGCDNFCSYCIVPYVRGRERSRRADDILREAEGLLQSGNDDILRLMNRRYTREDYLRKVEKLRAAVPGIGLTTDLIVSFPGETEKQFEDTCSLVREVGYDAAFTFIYSPREGTRAAAMEGRIPEAESTRRIEQLIREVEASTARVHQSMIGKHENVLVESLSKRDERKVSGKGTRGITVTLDGTEADIGTIIPVTITSAAVNTLRGERTER